jgi:hypothetical protein
MNSFVEKFYSIERAIAQEKGEFKLFALFELEGEVRRRWDVVISSEGLPENDMEALRFVINKIRVVLEQEEFMQLSKVVLSMNPLSKNFKSFLRHIIIPNFFHMLTYRVWKLTKAILLLHRFSLLKSPQKY